MSDAEVEGEVIEYRRPIGFRPVGLADFDAQGKCELLEYRGIRFTRVGVAEFDDDDGLLGAVAREEITRLALRRGPLGERPKMQVALGGVLFLIGMIPVFGIRSLPELIFAGLPWICVVGVVGSAVIFAALRSCDYVQVDSSRGVIRFIFRPPSSGYEVEAFIQSVEEVFGYAIDRDTVASRRVKSQHSTRP